MSYDLFIIKTCDFISKRSDVIWPYLEQESKLNFGSVSQKKTKVLFHDTYDIYLIWIKIMELSREIFHKAICSTLEYFAL